LETLAREIDWAKKWNNYPDYRALCEFARSHGILVRALNAPAATIRAVSRGGGIAKLPPDLRAQLPSDIFTDDPVDERLTNLQLATHMALDPAKLRPVFEAQASRDETMAANIVAARRVMAPPDEPRTAVVILGAGHMRYGLGTAERVRRRDPGIVERLVIISDSNQGQMTDAQKAQTRDIPITHADLRLRRPATRRLPAPPSGRRRPEAPTRPPTHSLIRSHFSQHAAETSFLPPRPSLHARAPAARRRHRPARANRDRPRPLCRKNRRLVRLEKSPS